MPEFYTATEAAARLQISEKTVRKRIASGEIPAVKGRDERNVEVWQIAADWLHRNTPEPMPEPSQQGYQPDRNDTPEQAGMNAATEPEQADTESETGDRRADSLAVITPEITAIVIAEQAGIVATVVSRAVAPLQATIEDLAQTNAALHERLAALEAAQKANEASRAEDARKARDEAAAREERIVEVAREHVRIKADNERLRNENAALKNRKWWQWSRG